jgi:AcrR family transcriptional regulator
MGRKSLAGIRREEILAAVERCIIRHGLAATTCRRIAEEASMPPSLVAHYVGSKERVLDAAVERMLERVRGGFEAAVARAPAGRKVARLLAVLFDGSLAAPEIGLVMDELIARSYRSEGTRRRVLSLYLEFERLIRSAIDADHPRAKAALRRDVAYGLLCLADANSTFTSIGIDPAHGRRARGLARALVARLGHGGRP